jgi:hypothetical protein
MLRREVGSFLASRDLLGREVSGQSGTAIFGVKPNGLDELFPPRSHKPFRLRRLQHRPMTGPGTQARMPYCSYEARGQGRLNLRTGRAMVGGEHRPHP